jgi:hypothetical protein
LRDAGKDNEADVEILHVPPSPDWRACAILLASATRNVPTPAGERNSNHQTTTGERPGFRIFSGAWRRRNINGLFRRFCPVPPSLWR